VLYSDPDNGISTDMRRIFRRAYSKETNVVTEIPDPELWVNKFVRSSRWNLEGLELKIAEANDYSRMASTIEKFRTSTRIANRVDRGDACVVAYVNGSLAHFHWVTFTPQLSGDDHTVLHLGENEAYTYDSYTVPKFRRRGIASEAKKFLLMYLIHRGIQTVYAMHKSDNVASSGAALKRHRRGRSRTIGSITITNFFGMLDHHLQADTPEDYQKLTQLVTIQQS
jgi:GNAT superfamily N-acetyltransferase